jgi:hypothetical protein
MKHPCLLLVTWTIALGASCSSANECYDLLNSEGVKERAETCRGAPQPRASVSICFDGACYVLEAWPAAEDGIWDGVVSHWPDRSGAVGGILFEPEAYPWDERLLGGLIEMHYWDPGEDSPYPDCAVVQECVDDQIYESLRFRLSEGLDGTAKQASMARALRYRVEVVLGDLADHGY